MNDFDFLQKEMVYGKKHLQKINYDTDKYKFVEMVTQLFNKELNKLHEIQENNYNLFTKIEEDSNTEFHKTFYKKLDQNWDEIKNEYDNFVKNEILPYLNLNEAMVQKFQLSDNNAS